MSGASAASQPSALGLTARSGRVALVPIPSANGVAAAQLLKSVSCALRVLCGAGAANK